MNKELFRIVSTGSVASDYSVDSVIKNLIDRFSVKKEVAEKLVLSKVVIRKALPLETANKFKKQLAELGLKVVIVQEKATAKPGQPAGPEERNPSTSDNAFAALQSATIPRVKVTMAYRLGLFLVILISTIAPLVYLGILAGLVAVVALYINVLPGFLEGIHSGVGKIAVVVVPVFIPAVLFLFLLKPLFTRHRPPPRYVLKRENFPALFTLVETLCEKIKVPVPVKIVLDNEVNASAGSARGILSLVRGKLVLTVGMPLVMGMSIREFAGVLAHEFGHFAQPSAMTAYYVVNSINYWFASRAYEPDAWDSRLEAWSDTANHHIVGTLAIQGARLGIYLTRKLFGVLYRLNLVTTRFMSRHMEHDADVYESIVSGSDQFEKTALVFRRLAYAEQSVDELNRQSWNENKLFKNYPDAIATMVGSLDADFDDRIREDMMQAQTNAWDSHPADNDRIRHVMKRNDVGILKDDRPARELCKDIDSLAEAVTLHMYRQAGIRDPEQYVEDNDTLLQQDKEKKQASEALVGYFDDAYIGRFLNLNPLGPNGAVPASLDECINTIRENLVEYRSLNKEYRDLENKYLVMSLGEAFITGGIKVKPETFDLKSAKADDMATEISSVKTSLSTREQKLRALDCLFYHRLQYDLKLMNEQQASDLKNKLQIVNGIGALSENLFDLEHCLDVLEKLLSDDDFLEAVQNEINRYGQYCFEQASRVLSASKNIPYGKQDVEFLSEFIGTWTGETLTEHNRQNPYDTFHFATNVLGAVKYHYYWTLAELSGLAGSVEAAHGIAPIKID